MKLLLDALKEALGHIQRMHDDCLHKAQDIRTGVGKKSKMGWEHYNDQAIGLSHAIDVLGNVVRSATAPVTPGEVPAPAELSAIEAKWRAWLKDNPDADQHQRYYVAGVIDGLKFSSKGEPFRPDWKQSLELKE